MKQNTKLFFLLLLFIPFLFSCKKDSSDNSDYYIKMKIKGTWVTWKTAAGQLGKETNPIRSGFSLMGKSDSGTEDFNIQASVDALPNFIPGTYTPDNSFLVASYSKKTSATDFISYTGGGIMGGADTRYELIITSVTDKVVKGSFTGTYLRKIDDVNDLMQITDGEFVVPIIP